MRPLTRTLRAALIGVAVLALAGCTGMESAPNDYGEVNTNNDGYYGNFMFGCTGVEANDDGEYDQSSLSAERLRQVENPEFCTCVFEGLKETVPFSEMQQLEEAQAEAEPGEFTLPRNVNAVRESCDRLA